MSPAEAGPAALVLMFALGARHGIEPDHMAAVDGMALRAHDRGDRVAPWIGTLFAIGHGAGVTVMALVIQRFSSGVQITPGVVDALEWVPLLLLYAVGGLNLRRLLGADSYQPASVRGWLVPARWRERSDAWAALVVGLLFALVLDVVTQLSAWSYSASQHGSVASVLVAGAVFSAGLALTATFDSALLCHLLKRRQSAQSMLRLRRALGWFVVLLSFGVALAGTFDKLGRAPAGAPIAVWLALAGLVAVAALGWALRQRGGRRSVINARALSGDGPVP